MYKHTLCKYTFLKNVQTYMRTKENPRPKAGFPPRPSIVGHEGSRVIRLRVKAQTLQGLVKVRMDPEVVARVKGVIIVVGATVRVALPFHAEPDPALGSVPLLGGDGVEFGEFGVEGGDGVIDVHGGCRLCREAMYHRNF